MGRIRTIVFLTLALFLCAFALQEQVFVEQQQPQSQVSLFEMSLEELMEVEVTLASREEENPSKPARATYRTDSKEGIV